MKPANLASGRQMKRDSAWIVYLAAIRTTARAPSAKFARAAITNNSAPAEAARHVWPENTTMRVAARTGVVARSVHRESMQRAPELRSALLATLAVIYLTMEVTFKIMMKRSTAENALQGRCLRMTFRLATIAARFNLSTFLWGIRRSFPLGSISHLSDSFSGEICK